VTASYNLCCQLKLPRPRSQVYQQWRHKANWFLYFIRTMVSYSRFLWQWSVTADCSHLQSLYVFKTNVTIIALQCISVLTAKLSQVLSWKAFLQSNYVTRNFIVTLEPERLVTYVICDVYPTAWPLFDNAPFSTQSNVDSDIHISSHKDIKTLVISEKDQVAQSVFSIATEADATTSISSTTSQRKLIFLFSTTSASRLRWQYTVSADCSQSR
jgi:hypothetical protein